MKMKILVGTLKFEAGTFEKGEVVEVPLERFKLFDQTQVEVVPDEPVVAVPEVAQENIIIEASPIAEDKPVARIRKAKVVSDA